MTTQEIQLYIEQNPLIALLGVVFLSLIVFMISRLVIGRGLTYIARRTETKYDDIIVENLKPFRVAWIAPLLILYFFAYLSGEYQLIIERATLFLVLWMVVITLSSLLNALNTIYERRPTFTGVSIQGYLDLVKLLFIAIGIILSVSLITGQSLLFLLTGLGALTAILLLVFRDTILSIVASVQIVTNDLIREGDWIEVPSYEADGDVLNISLHTVKIQNWDMTISVIPTYKMVEVAFKNWRGMKESGGRRIMRSIILDMNTIKFCDDAMLAKLSNVDLIKDYVDHRMDSIREYHKNRPEYLDSPLDGPQITNAEIFRVYIEKYLRSLPAIHQEKLPLLVRALSPSEQGLPVEVYAFTKTIVWEEYERIQAEIFDHLIAVALYFDLRVFQQPTGFDFSTFANLRQ